MSRGRWVRVDAMIHDHPKVVRVGATGLAVIQAAWRLSKANCFRGEIPAAFWTTAMLGRWTLMGDCPEVAAGMAACEAVGLVTAVTRDNRDIFELHDWTEYQEDETAAERQARHRDRARNAVTPRKDVPVTMVTRDVTMSQDMTGQDRTGGSSPDLRTSRDINDTTTHPPAIETEAPRASRPWIVQSEWTAAYDAAYGHPPYWDARRHEEGARALISYLEGLCAKRRMELTDQTLREGTQRAAGKYLADKSAWLTKTQHPFDQLVKNIHVYLHENRKG